MECKQIKRKKFKIPQNYRILKPISLSQIYSGCYYYYYYKMYWLEWRCHSITVAGTLNNEKQKRNQKKKKKNDIDISQYLAEL